MDICLNTNYIINILLKTQFVESKKKKKKTIDNWVEKMRRSKASIDEHKLEI